MHITGIISEYNPFHKGHVYHIKKTREWTSCDILIAVMSGNFVQRGEPAIYDKWQRSKIAVENGCDIVLELPFLYATQSAQNFAKGAIQTLALAHVDDIVFGSESNDLKQLITYAQMDPEDILINAVKSQSPAKSYGEFYEQLGPNDILGINYIRYCEQNHIQPYTIKRTNHYHDETIHTSIASASAIRKAILQGDDIHKQTDMNMDQFPHRLADYYPYIQSLLLTLPITYLKTIFLMDEGIESLFVKAASTCMNMDEFLDACISRRYTRSRIQRILIHLLTQTTKEEVNHLPQLQHIRVLAYNRRGQAYLKSIKDQTIIASRFNQIPQPYRSITLKANHVYAYPLSEEDKKTCYKQELQPPQFIDQ